MPAATKLKLNCNTLQHTAAHCSTLQHTATHCNTLRQLNRNNATHQVRKGTEQAREFEMKLLHYFFESDNKSNRHH